MGVEVMLKFKIADSGASSRGNSKSTGPRASQTNRPSRYSMAQPHQNTCHHYWHQKFPASGITTPYWVRSWLQLPQWTFEPPKHCFTSLCIRSIVNLLIFYIRSHPWFFFFVYFLPLVFFYLGRLLFQVFFWSEGNFIHRQRWLHSCWLIPVNEFNH